MSRIFVYSASLPRFDMQAGDRRFAELLRMLADKNSVDLCLESNEADPSNPQVVAQTEKYRRYLVEGGVRLLPAGWRHVERNLLRETYEFGLFEFYYNAARILPLFRKYQPQARVLVDTVDVHYVRERAAAELGLIPAARAQETRTQELAVYRQADIVLAISELDQAELEKEAHLPPVAVVPLIVPIRPRTSQRHEQELLFVGGFQHPPNLDGLQWFVAEIWPHICSAVPEARLTVVGSNAPAEVQQMGKLPGVAIAGYVPDTSVYLDRAAVSVAPLRYGAGMKGKVTEAMACGVPVVTTTVGIQGLPAILGEEVCVADDPASFAAAVISLLRDPARAASVGRAGQEFIARICGHDVVAAKAEEALELAAQQPRTCPVYKSRTWDRVHFEAARVLWLPHWGPQWLFRRYFKARLRTLRNRLLRRPHHPSRLADA